MKQFIWVWHSLILSTWPRLSRLACLHTFCHGTTYVGVASFEIFGQVTRCGMPRYCLLRHSLPRCGISNWAEYLFNYPTYPDMSCPAILCPVMHALGVACCKTFVQQCILPDNALYIMLDNLVGQPVHYCI